MEMLIKRFQQLPIGADYKELITTMVKEGHDKDLVWLCYKASQIL